MSFLTTWVTNIIVFILFAVVLDMLLPNSSMQKYTKLVIGLLLTAIFLTPILSLFKQDFASDIQQKIMSNGVWGGQTMENSLETKKKEIEETQQAYILEQMAVQHRLSLRRHGSQAIAIDKKALILLQKQRPAGSRYLHAAPDHIADFQRFMPMPWHFRTLQIHMVVCIGINIVQALDLFHLVLLYPNLHICHILI